MTCLSKLNKQIVSCRACPRLVQWREQIATQKRAAFAHEKYWGKPVPGFGDPGARILICGLAPAAHGGNRTGRIFTGDRSGDWLYAALFRAGLASQPHSVNRNDGMNLFDCYITACVHCAPPDNKPTVQERDTCLAFLEEELKRLPAVKVIVCLGQFAWNCVLRTNNKLGWLASPRPVFGHGTKVKVGPYVLIGSYHPSQQNTFTGRLTEPMLDQVVQTATRIARRTDS
jgi:uracil-DNA glycosylase family 4